jgi:hypothetical protein
VNNMVDHQEVTWVSRGPRIRSGKCTSGSRQEMMLRSDAGSITPMQPVTAPNQDSGPNASVQCGGSIQKDSHQCSRALPMEQRRKLIPPDRYGLLYQAAESLCHSQSRGFDSGRSTGYLLLLPLWSTVGATQFPVL